MIYNQSYIFKMPFGVLTLLACLVSLGKSAAEYTLVKHPIETGARCLDGT
jgi:hypothetical protein